MYIYIDHSGSETEYAALELRKFLGEFTSAILVSEKSRADRCVIPCRRTHITGGTRSERGYQMPTDSRRLSPGTVYARGRRRTTVLRCRTIHDSLSKTGSDF